jgi:hypothetical protein
MSELQSYCRHLGWNSRSSGNNGARPRKTIIPHGENGTG